ncbi:E3 ubiquitin-protein ligase PRT6 [Quillaja saponaria]|uniref:E3 ubiquitin-protein ligase n=1 Tax=Quillaja saponaria TaxID=32244 RepID=A0AAD7L2G8_QUISA|nr:E3 ubiquitin-protein ligase PRT6 [Quillaja saponaria]
MVDKMEIESPLDYLRLDPQDRILRRLAQLGVPEEYLNGLQPGLVAFVKDNKTCIPQIVSAILPTDVEVEEVFKEAELGSEKLSEGPTMKKQFRQSMGWIQWLIFDGNPSAALTKLSEMTVGQRGVCGAVWGQNDIAYKCRTCGYDPTCAICVPCFENGNHIGHDYSVIYTGSGCCDCGDVTAWKREGFCSKHKGVEQIQPLSEEFAESVRPVLNALFSFWKGKLMSVETICVENPRASDCVAVRKKFANELTFVIVELLLGFCKTSESLLSFIARLLFSHTGLLDILVRAERFLIDVVVKKLHELLLKLLGEPIFKYEFAKVFLSYYPSVVSDVIKECSNRPLKYPLLSTFSVQIFTVPTLTPRLVKEMNLLAMLMGCLGDIFIYCAGEDGRLQVAKWEYLYEITLRVVEDIRFVMSHVVVPKYVTRDQQDISRTWMKLLAFVQGMNPQKRETGLHIEEENEIVHLPFILCHSIANIHTLLVVGAFSVASNGEADDEIFLSTSEQDRDDGDSLRHAKVGRLSQESSACNAVGRNNAIPCSSKGSDIKSDTFPHPKLPPSVLWLIYECLRAIENCLGVDNMSGLHSSLNSISGSNVSAFKRTLSKIRKGEYTFGRLASSTEDHGAHCSSHGYHAGDLESSKSTMHDDKLRITGEIDSVKTCNSAGFDDIEMEGECAVETGGTTFSEFV